MCEKEIPIPLSTDIIISPSSVNPTDQVVRIGNSGLLVNLHENDGTSVWTQHFNPEAKTRREKKHRVKYTLIYAHALLALNIWWGEEANFSTLPFRRHHLLKSRPNLAMENMMIKLLGPTVYKKTPPFGVGIHNGELDLQALSQDHRTLNRLMLFSKRCLDAQYMMSSLV